MATDTTSGRFSVSVSKDYLTFSAAHFLTIPNHKCESLHGHNYVEHLLIMLGSVTYYGRVKR